jgi:mRNA-degrading endonuclease toxin of MazEF toxin-antitoxin module
MVSKSAEPVIVLSPAHGESLLKRRPWVVVDSDFVNVSGSLKARGSIFQSTELRLASAGEVPPLTSTLRATRRALGFRVRASATELGGGSLVMSGAKRRMLLRERTCSLVRETT